MNGNLVLQAQVNRGVCMDMAGDCGACQQLAIAISTELIRPRQNIVPYLQAEPPGSSYGPYTSGRIRSAGRFFIAPSDTFPLIRIQARIKLEAGGCCLWCTGVASLPATAACAAQGAYSADPALLQAKSHLPLPSALLAQAAACGLRSGCCPRYFSSRCRRHAEGCSPGSACSTHACCLPCCPQVCQAAPRPPPIPFTRCRTGSTAIGPRAARLVS